MKAFLSLLSDVSKFGNLSLTKIENEYPDLVYYFVNELIPMIKEYELVEKRAQLQSNNKVTVPKKEAIQVRNEILGVGCKGVINNLINLAILFEKEEQFKDIA